MRKFLTLVSVVAVAGAISTASAMDRTGKIGLGFQESFMQSGNFGATTLGSWSLKYGINKDFTAQLGIGFDFGVKNFNRMVQFGARLLYNLVEMENSNFYTGVGVGYVQDKAAVEARALRMHLPLGWEFSFAGLPEVGFSAEVGLVYDMCWDVTGAKTHNLQSMGGQAGGNLGLGIHYYF